MNNPGLNSLLMPRRAPYQRQSAKIPGMQMPPSTAGSGLGTTGALPYPFNPQPAGGPQPPMDTGNPPVTPQPIPYIPDNLPGAP